MPMSVRRVGRAAHDVAKLAQLLGYVAVGLLRVGGTATPRRPRCRHGKSGAVIWR